MAVKKLIPKSAVQGRLEIVRATGKTYPEHVKMLMDTTPKLIISTISKNIVLDICGEKVEPTKTIQEGISSESTS